MGRGRSTGCPVSAGPSKGPPNPERAGHMCSRWNALEIAGPLFCGSPPELGRGRVKLVLPQKDYVSM